MDWFKSYFQVKPRSLSKFFKSSIYYFRWLSLLKVRQIQFNSVQSLSCVRLFTTPWITARQASLSITNSRSSLKLTSIESVMPSSHLILCRPLLLLPPIPPSIRVFSNESTLCLRWPKYWSFSLSISPSSEHPGLISFRMDWWDLLAVQGTLRSLLQHHSSKAYLQHSIYIVLGIISNLENLIYTGKHAQFTGKCYVIYMRTLSTHSFRYLLGVGAWNQFPTYTIIKNESHCVC